MLRTRALILGALAASILGWSAPAHSAPPASSEQRLSRITVRSEGRGCASRPHPGLASSAAVYGDVAAKIGKGRRLIFVQVNGFAGSKPGDGTVEGLMPGAVDDLAAWLSANNIQKPAVIGHSMGGLMAMMLAKNHPSAAGRLLIVDALPFYGAHFIMLDQPQRFTEEVRRFLDGK
jgi:hypothetical protein